MKVGETVPVHIGQSVVAQAKIVEMGDGTATLVIPATRAVMSVVTRLDDTPVTPTGGTEHAILGVETQETSNVETPAVPADAVTPPAPAVESTPAPVATATADGSATQSGSDTAGVNEVTTVDVAPPVETTTE